MKAFITWDQDYGKVDHGTFIDKDGDRFGGMPGIVAHDAEWAEIAVEVEGGYMAFDGKPGYETWNSQK